MCASEMTTPMRRPAPLLAAAMVVLYGCGGDVSQLVVPPPPPPPPPAGAIDLAIAGLPGGAAAQITVSGPAGFTSPVTSSRTLSGLAPGSYTITAEAVLLQDALWSPAPPSQTVTVAAGATAGATVGYQLATGFLTISMTGAPFGSSPSITVTGPNDFQLSVSATTTLTGLTPGEYTIAAAPFALEGDGYTAAQPTQAITVAAALEPAHVAVIYGLATGRLAVTVHSVPTDADASVTVSGPNGYHAVLTASAMLVGLVPGGYTVTAAEFATGGVVHAPSPPVQNIEVSASLVPVEAAIGWNVVPGALAVAIAGLPPNVPAAVTLTGPGGYQRLLTASETVAALVPGDYLLEAAPVEAGGFLWAPSPVAQQVTVGSSTAQASVSYSAATGTLSVTVAGLPSPSGDVTVTGPGGYLQHLAATTALPGLAPGVYQVGAGGVTLSGTNWLPSPASQEVTVADGAVAAATVTYAPATGSLAVAVSGLPGGVNAAVTLHGPEGATVPVTGSQTIHGLTPGAWMVQAQTVLAGGDTYQPVPTSQPVTVSAGVTAAVAVGYTLVPAISFNLRIEKAYLTQGIQRPDHGVELVAGRDAYLRVFAVANEPNAVQPQVRVRLYHGAVEVQQALLDAPGVSVPLSMDEGTLAHSWNLLVPGALVQPGLRLLAEVDPTGAIAESNLGDNLFPASGVPLPVTVRALAPFRLRLVPVLQSVNGLVGDVTGANATGYLSLLLKTMPIADWDVDVRETYTTNAPVLQSNDANGAWGTVLSEVLALRNVVDLSDRYYYGVVKTTYSSGVAGVGYVGSPGGSYKAAIGWDRSNSRASVLAHELGHNFGRWHAPCGNPSGVDSNYPHTGGKIGFWGLDLSTLALRSPSIWNDLMGYCSSEWVSDYTWNAVMNFRALSPTGAPPAAALAAGEDDGLLVWGRIGPAGMVLEPAFRVPVGGRPPPPPGPYRVEGRDPAGALLFSQAFDAAEVADLPGGAERHFAFVVPIGAVTADRLAALRLVGPGVPVVERRASPMAPPSRAPEVRAASAVQRRFTWDAARRPMALVRNPVTGEILSFARGGEIVLWTTANALDVQLSDGVQVERRRVVVR